MKNIRAKRWNGERNGAFSTKLKYSLQILQLQWHFKKNSIIILCSQFYTFSFMQQSVTSTIIKTIYFQLCALYDVLNILMCLADTGSGSMHRFHCVMLACSAIAGYSCGQSCCIVCERCTVKLMHGILNQCQLDTYESLRYRTWHPTVDNLY